MKNNLNAILDSFALVTVMNVKVFKIKDCQYGKTNLARTNFEQMAKQSSGNALYLDTLKISSIKETGPQKVFKAGIKNMPIVRHGKQVEMDLQDAIGRIDTLLAFFGIKHHDKLDIIYSDDSFGEPLALEGEMKCVDLNGDTTTLYLFIPCFIPKSSLTLVQDSEANIGSFDLSGELKKMSVTVSDTETIECYYLIESIPFFDSNTAITRVPIYHNDCVSLVSVAGLDDEALSVVFGPDTPVYAKDDVEIKSGLDEN